LTGVEGTLDWKVQIRARVKSNSELMPRTRLVWLDAPAIAELARPGQFVMVRCGEGHDPLLRRPLSIHKTDDSGGVALLFVIVGRGTSWLSERVPEESVDLIGPLGNGFVVKRNTKNLLLASGGVGFTPLAFMAETAIKEGMAVRLLMGARSAEYLYPTSQLPKGIDIVPATEDGSKESTGLPMKTGLVTQIIGELAGQADQVFACGPAAMYRSMAELECLKSKSVQVSLEERMACGVGACYGCTVKTRNGPKQVCQDGPVFELADIVW
jgi:dihydroorotate dehydrogenase electron transfer subunit